jgi:hypothetical protein
MRAWSQATVTARRTALALALFLFLGCNKPAHDIVLLQQQRPLTDAEYERATAAWVQGKKADEERATYMKSNGLDEATFLPGQGWKDVVNPSNPFRTFLANKLSREQMNQLRFHTNVFTRWDLYNFDYPGKHPPVPGVVSAAEYDAKHRDAPLDISVAAFKKIRARIPDKYLVKVPRIMGEIGWDVDGYVVNRDLAAYQDAIAILYQSGVLPWLENRAASGKPVTVLEIGSGYGGLTYFFSEILPKASYWACDLPESLIVAAMYLSVTRPKLWRGIYPECSGSCSGEGIFGLPNYRFEEFSAKGRKVDLVINTMSLSEMSEVQIRYYARKISEVLGDEGVFFEVNYDNRPVEGTNAKEFLPHYLKVSVDLGQSFNRGHGHLWANDPAVLHQIGAERRFIAYGSR